MPKIPPSAATALCGFAVAAGTPAALEVAEAAALALLSLAALPLIDAVVGPATGAVEVVYTSVVCPSEVLVCTISSVVLSAAAAKG